MKTHLIVERPIGTATACGIRISHPLPDGMFRTEEGERCESVAGYRDREVKAAGDIDCYRCYGSWAYKPIQRRLDKPAAAPRSSRSIAQRFREAVA